MEGPGTSLFQGSESLHLDPNKEREEEEEALQDQKRRDEELRNLLTNAFDDLIEEDEDDASSVNSSYRIPNTSHDQGHGRFANTDSIIFKHMVSQTSNQPAYNFNNNDGSENVGMSNQEYPTYENSHLMNGEYTGGGDSNISSHYRYCYRTSPGGYIVDNDVRHTPDQNQLYRQTSYNSVEQLEVLYSVRVREVQRLTQQLEEFSNEAAKERDEMFTKLAFWEAEQERAKSLHKEAEQQLSGIADSSLLDSSVDRLILGSVTKCWKGVWGPFTACGETNKLGGALLIVLCLATVILLGSASKRT
uniref:Uncharacterized protein n=1 Tax=Timema genevievae TaxID=629358 RepID=A0A7R9JYL0_TIMGE|nr:unnamed protein product [Timema genevievae]